MLTIPAQCQDQTDVREGVAGRHTPGESRSYNDNDNNNNCNNENVKNNNNDNSGWQTYTR